MYPCENMAYYKKHLFGQGSLLLALRGLLLKILINVVNNCSGDAICSLPSPRHNQNSRFQQVKGSFFSRQTPGNTRGTNLVAQYYYVTSTILKICEV